MRKKMKWIGRQMAVRMAVVMSFFLSIVGMGSSGHFSPVGFLISFVISILISLLIGLIVPVGMLTNGASRALKLKPDSLPGRLLGSFISNTIYTPIMTCVMVYLAYNNVMRESGQMAEVTYGKMLLGSLPVCYIVGFVLCFIFTPLFMNKLMKKWDETHNDQ